jgi:hypothetical protein
MKLVNSVLFSDPSMN